MRPLQSHGLFGYTRVPLGRAEVSENQLRRQQFITGWISGMNRCYVFVFGTTLFKGFATKNQRFRRLQKLRQKQPSIVGGSPRRCFLWSPSPVASRQLGIMHACMHEHPPCNGAQAEPRAPHIGEKQENAYKKIAVQFRS